MATTEYLRRYGRPIAMMLLLAVLVFYSFATEQSAAVSKRLHQRQLDLYINGIGYADTSIGYNTSYSQHLQARGPYDGWKAIPAASDDEYAVAQKRGAALLCWLEHPDEVPRDKATSPWNDFDELKEWGWVEKTQTQNGGERDPGLREIFENSDLDIWAGTDKKLVVEHTEEHPAEGGMTYPPTGAKYENYIYPRHGLLLAEYNYGPDTMIATKMRKPQWDSSTQSKPKLYQLSDVMWLGWAKYAPPELRGNLKTVAIHNIGNASTKAIMAKIMQSTLPSIGPSSLGMAPEWPGKTCTPGMAEFSALLGSQGVWAVPYLLIQRGGAEFLGKRLMIEKIVVYTAALSKWNSDPTFMLYLKELEQGQ